MIRRLFDKYFLLFFYGFLIVGIVIAVIFFINIKQEQKSVLLAYEKNINIKQANETLKLETNKGIDEEKLTYKSSNENIVHVDESGNVTAVGEGSTIITVATKDKKQQQVIVVNVGKEAIDNYIELNPTDNKEIASTKPIESTPPQSGENTENKNNNTSNNNTQSKPNNKPSQTNKNSVSSVSLDKSSGTINLNTSTKTITLKATVLPATAKNKNITWSSSNPSVATVNNGVVTAKNPGQTIITVKTQDGEKTAAATITVTKKVIIIIGASQVTRMVRDKNAYSSPTNNYKTSDGTLVYVEKGGSGIPYQTREGFNIAQQTINSYSNAKGQVSLYIFFPLSGNTIKTFTCDEISSSNEKIKNYAKDYNNAIQKLKTLGYNVKGYVTSMHPVRVGQAKNEWVVANEDKNACAVNYRSNWKYYQFNKAIKSVILNNYSRNLEFESLLIKIMNTNNEKKNFSYKVEYNTDDGIHWVPKTTDMYVDLMLNYSGDL